MWEGPGVWSSIGLWAGLVWVQVVAGRARWCWRLCGRHCGVGVVGVAEGELVGAEPLQSGGIFKNAVVDAYKDDRGFGVDFKDYRNGFAGLF